MVRLVRQIWLGILSIRLTVLCSRKSQGPFQFFEATDIDKQIQDLLKQGLIRRSTSPFGFNIVLDIKKDKSVRMNVNYNKLNSVTRNNATPMHNANKILRLLLLVVGIQRSI